MSSWQQEEALRGIGRGLESIAKAIESASRNREPVFIMVPSNIEPEELKKFAAVLRDALRKD